MRLVGIRQQPCRRRDAKPHLRHVLFCAAVLVLGPAANAVLHHIITASRPEPAHVEHLLWNTAMGKREAISNTLKGLKCPEAKRRLCSPETGRSIAADPSCNHDTGSGAYLNREEHLLFNTAMGTRETISNTLKGLECPEAKRRLCLPEAGRRVSADLSCNPDAGSGARLKGEGPAGALLHLGACLLDGALQLLQRGHCRAHRPIPARDSWTVSIQL